MMSRCSTWQNASLKKPNENAEYPQKTPIPKEELEAESKPLPVGPIALWQTAMITKYDLMLIEFSRDHHELDHNEAKQALLGFENVLAREG